MNEIQVAAYELIQSDARFIYSLTAIKNYNEKIKSNYMMMSLPYMGIFTDGSEQWCKKVGLEAPSFNKEEKIFYTKLRLSHKLFEKPYEEYKELLVTKFNESNNYFYNLLNFAGRLLGFYYNVGVDPFNGEFCGNTILCAMYIPIKTLGNDNDEEYIKNISTISGELASYFGCNKLPPYKFDHNLTIIPKDYHFFKRCPIKLKNEFGLLLFSIICSINYCTVFIEDFFIVEIPQKFKFAYLQYYYLCSFIPELNKANGTNFFIDPSMKDKHFRNCIAHYGLGQYINKSELISNDILKGLTIKAFKLDYISSKKRLFKILNNLSNQIKNYVLK